jgi:hypothetical protein
MPENLKKMVALIVDGSNDDLFIELQRITKMHSYSDYEWLEATSQMNKESLESFIKKLIMMRKRNSSHTGGSVSPVRWLYSQYKNSFEDINNSLYDWIVQNSENSYEPTGSAINRR